MSSELLTYAEKIKSNLATASSCLLTAARLLENSLVVNDVYLEKSHFDNLNDDINNMINKVDNKVISSINTVSYSNNRSSSSTKNNSSSTSTSKKSNTTNSNNNSVISNNSGSRHTSAVSYYSDSLRNSYSN